MTFIHHKFLSSGYRKNLGKAFRALGLSLLGKSPYSSYWVGVGMRVTQLLNSLLGRSRYKTTSAYCGYQCWAVKPPKLRYIFFVFFIDTGARYLFKDIDHCRGAAITEGLIK